MLRVFSIKENWIVEILLLLGLKFKVDLKCLEDRRERIAV